MVNRKRIVSKYGIAAMFDALLFLTVASVVVATTVILSAPPIEEVDAQAQELAERTHLVLCRMSVQPPGMDEETMNDSDGPFLTVSTIVVGIFVEAGGKAALPSWLNSTIARVLGEVLEPRYSYLWMVSDGGSAISVASFGQPPPLHGNVFVSSLELGGDPAIRSTLSIWSSG
jgi:hypothetical protein